MLKNLASICAALIIAAGLFSSSAQAQRGQGSSGGGHVGGGGGHVGGGGGHVGGAGMGGVSGARVGGFGGGRIGGPGPASRGNAYSGAGRYPQQVYRHDGRRHRRHWDGHRYRYRYGYYYGGFWPYWDWGWSEWPYYYDDSNYDSAVAYCIRHFKSYDPVSRTYLGYDGHRHSCP
jgi:hypothetical protein